MPREERVLVGDLTSQLNLSDDEARLYLKSVRERVLRGSPLPKGVRGEVVISLLARGLLIQAANGKDYLPVHPRLALSNLFRTHEEKVISKRKEKRLLVDKLTLELISIYEASKSTNAGVRRVREDE